MSRPRRSVGVWRVRPETLASRRRLYLLARVVVARHYRRELTLAVLATALSSSPRQLQRAYSQCGEVSFSEDLINRRMTAAAELLLAQRSIPVSAVARLVGYRQGQHFAQAFRRRFGVSPGSFREHAAIRAAGDYSARGGEEAGDPAATGSRGAGSSPLLIGSAKGRRRRISAPPPGAVSAATLPPC
jgi:AraC-like DNA-binding protein